MSKQGTYLKTKEQVRATHANEIEKLKAKRKRNYLER